MNQRAAFISHTLFTDANWGPHHPLGQGRHRSVVELCSHLGWLRPEAIFEVEPASPETLARLHDPEYIEALKAATTAGSVSREVRERFHIGTMENPLFASVFQRAAATAGGSIRAAELALDGCPVFHPAGGTHHGKRDRASGFCYFNDPAFAILTFLDAGAAPVLYVDLDAHHGDGVEAMFGGEDRVFLISIHEDGRWPHTGALKDRAGGNARNLPVPKGFHDAELAFLMAEVVLALAARIKPEAIVLTCGADPLHGDPLSGMELSNNALWQAIDRVRGLAPSVVLGGGGYNPWTVARFWAGLWGRIAGHPPAPEPLPQGALDLLAALSSDLVDEDELEPQWLASIADAPLEVQPVRKEIREIAAAVMVD